MGRNKGYVLIITLLLLLAATLVVIGASRTSIISEKSTGSHMERGRAKLAAEQSVRQGLQALTANADACLVSATCSGLAGVGAAVQAMPNSWPANDGAAANLDGLPGQPTTGRYLIRQLPADPFLPAAKRGECQAFSVMGRGQGLRAGSVVVIQTVAYVCPLS